MYSVEGRLPPAVDFGDLDGAAQRAAGSEAAIREAAEHLVVRWDWYSWYNDALDVDPFSRWTGDGPPRPLKKAPKVPREQVGYGFDERERVIVVRTGGTGAPGSSNDQIWLYEAQRIIEFDFPEAGASRRPHYAEHHLDSSGRPVLSHHSTSMAYTAIQYDWGEWGVTHQVRWHATRSETSWVIGDEFVALYNAAGALVEVRRKQRYGGETTEFRVWPKERNRSSHIYKHRLVFPRKALEDVLDAANDEAGAILFVKDRGCYLLAQYGRRSSIAAALPGDFDAMCGNDDFAHDVTAEVRAHVSSKRGDLVIETRVRETEGSDYELIEFTVH